MVVVALSYFVSLLACISLGKCYKELPNTKTKRNYGTGLGFLVVCMMCGRNTIHTVIIVLINIIIIKCCDKRYLHKISFSFTSLYLIYLYRNVIESNYEYWIYQTMAFRVVGVAFEVFLYLKVADLSSKLTESKGSQSNVPEVKTSKQEKLTIKAASDSGSESSRNGSDIKIHGVESSESRMAIVDKKQFKYDTDEFTSKSPTPGRARIVSEDVQLNSEVKYRLYHKYTHHKYHKLKMGSIKLSQDFITRVPDAVEIISYAYSFIGLHKGPYYRWKIFEDHFVGKFEVGNCREITERKVTKALILVAAYMFLLTQFNPEVLLEEKFYNFYHRDYRFLYCLPQLIMYYLEVQIIMLLCTSVFTETGFGIYPVKSESVPGHGPTSGLPLGAISDSSDQEYNFAMLKCFDLKKVMLGPRMIDTVSAWDISSRYWFKTYIYRNLIRSNKKVRRGVTMLVCGVWQGLNTQQMILTSTVWVYLELEHEYVHLFDTSRSFKQPWDMGLSIMRLLCLVYLTPCVIMHETAAVFRYYNSINWLFHIMLLILMLFALIFHQRQQGIFRYHVV